MRDSLLSAPFLHDDDMAETLSDTALVAAMIRSEVALANAQAGLGIIPSEAASAIADTATRLDVDMAALRDSVARNGVPVPALLSQFRAAMDAPDGDWLHWGATSQDIVDCALCLCYRDAFWRLRNRLGALLDGLETLSRSTARTPMVARTRGQLAVPITFGLRVARWAQPLIALEAEAADTATAAFRVQFGGAAGSRSIVHPHGSAIATAMAGDLGLSDSLPWHGDRTGLSRLNNWLSRCLTALEKIAGDVALATRTEISELGIGAGGRSSAMPHKANPVAAEAILSVVQLGRGLATTLENGISHAEERGGPAWAVEWLTLPDLLICTGSAVTKCDDMCRAITVRDETMAQRLDAHPEVFAESVVHALAPVLGRDVATGVVSEALATNAGLGSVVAEHLPAGTASPFDLAGHVDSAAVEAGLVFAARHDVEG